MWARDAGVALSGGVEIAGERGACRLEVTTSGTGTER